MNNVLNVQLDIYFYQIYQVIWTLSDLGNLECKKWQVVQFETEWSLFYDKNST